MNYLQVNKVTVSYKKKIALKPVSFEASQGKIIGFIGADGAGKSSLMHTIAGIIRFDGEIVFSNQSYRSPKEAERLKHHIGFMPQGLGLILYETLSVREHLEFFADIRGIKKDREFKAYEERLLHMAGLSQFVRRLAGNLSGGMMQKLALICTLLHRPRLLILDEPTTGVDPMSRLELWDILRQIVAEEQTLCIVSTAYMAEAEKMNRVLLFEDGEIIAQGKAEELIEGMRPFTYQAAPDPAEQTITIHGYTYSLNPLEVKPKEPTLEALFFVNFLKKRGTIPEISIVRKEVGETIPETIMEARGLTKRFGRFVANDNVDMRLDRGEILGLLGANGAGKTTFIKMLLGLLPMDGGELFLLEKRITSANDRQMLKAKIGYVSQHFALYKGMTVRENLLYFANMHKIDPRRALELVKMYADTLGFYDYLDVFPGDLPLGINQRFSVAAAIIHEPVVLFLDEPTSGVDVVARAIFWEMLQKLKNEWQLSILVTTHYMNEAEFCDRVVLLKGGKKIADDTVEHLYQKHPDAHNFEDIFLEYF
ncbi:MAG: Trehalose/maltose import ATP-binding protein MalK [Candidatus Methanolliviera sp. GoM_oil]|nr:MAG: Trehalose/maltose import ATP-binding protein MalK [Candidatus Methanolliviera sp. GoM_oil]